MSDDLRARLFQGAFICPSTDRPSFERLRDEPAYRDSIDQWLGAAGYQLNETAIASAYFSGIRHANAREHGTDIGNQFKKAYEANAFARAFLDAARAAADTSIEFRSGELLRGADLYQAIQASEAHLARLRKLWTRLGKKNNQVNDHRKMTDVLDHLADEGYLIQESKELGTYRVCGKIDHMFDMIEYAMSQAPDEGAETGQDELEDLEDLASALAPSHESSNGPSLHEDATREPLDDMLDERQPHGHALNGDAHG